MQTEKKETLKKEIIGLIQSKKEGTYWDFKQIPHKENNDLIKDIICLANCNHTGDRYLIIGVNDKKYNFTIKGLTKDTPNRRTTAQINDLMAHINCFAGDNRPEIEVETLNIENKEIDVIIIKDKILKPYYFKEDCNGLKAFHIYSRINDRNTSTDNSADYNDVKRMWMEQIGKDKELRDILIGISSILGEMFPFDQTEGFSENNREITKEQYERVMKYIKHDMFLLPQEFNNDVIKIIQRSLDPNENQDKLFNDIVDLKARINKKIEPFAYNDIDI